MARTTANKAPRKQGNRMKDLPPKTRKAGLVTGGVTNGISGTVSYEEDPTKRH